MANFYYNTTAEIEQNLTRCVSINIEDIIIDYVLEKEMSCL